MSWYWNLSSVLLGFAIILGVGWLIGVLEKRDRHRRLREKKNGTQNRERTDEVSEKALCEFSGAEATTGTGSSPGPSRGGAALCAATSGATGRHPETWTGICPEGGECHKRQALAHPPREDPRRRGRKAVGR